MRLLDRQWTERNDSTGGEKRLFCQSFIGQQVLGQKAMVGPIRPPDVFCPQTQQYLQTSGQRGQRRVFFHRRGPFGQTTARNKRGQKGAEELLPHPLRGRPALQEAGFGWGVGLTYAHANAHTRSAGLCGSGDVAGWDFQRQGGSSWDRRTPGSPRLCSVGEQCSPVAVAAAREHGRALSSENSERRIGPGLDI